mmetsp:Transcript_15390/g.27315  ORF Transcript_15390/g.27315 Transcript_15390/m.27315 type:complete len:210 (+) Transcript_15390:177-806(+)
MGAHRSNEALRTLLSELTSSNDAAAMSSASVQSCASGASATTSSGLRATASDRNLSFALAVEASSVPLRTTQAAADPRAVAESVCSASIVSTTAVGLSALPASAFRRIDSAGISGDSAWPRRVLLKRRSLPGPRKIPEAELEDQEAFSMPRSRMGLKTNGRVSAREGIDMPLEKPASGRSVEASGRQARPIRATGRIIGPLAPQRLRQV